MNRSALRAPRSLRLPGAASGLRWAGFIILVLAGGLGVAAVASPHQASYVEGFLLEQADRLAHGGALYRPLDGGPWIVDNFPPLYPLLLAPLAAVFGPSFWWGRLLTLLAAAGLAALLYRWSASAPGAPAPPARSGDLVPHALALGATALWALSPFVLRRAMLLRMDFAALLLSALGAWLIARRPGRRATLPLAALCFLAALLTRQTMVAAPLAAIVALLASRRRSEALRLALLLAGGGLAALALLQAATGGRFLLHTVTYNEWRWIGANYLAKSAAALALHLPLALLAAAGARAAWREGGLAARLPVLWLLAALPVTLTVGKSGSTYNHFLEVIWVAALLSGRGARSAAAALLPIARRLAPKGAAQASCRLLLLLLGLQLLVSAATPPLHTGLASLGEAGEEGRLVRLLAVTPGPVLSENAGALIESGHEVLIEPRTMSELARAGTWDPAPLHENLSRGAYSLLVIEVFSPPDRCPQGCRWDPASWQIVQEEYVPAERVGRWQLWRPAAP